MVPSALIPALERAADNAIRPVLSSGAPGMVAAPTTEVGFVAAVVLGGVPAGMAAADKASTLVWRQRRGMLLAGFSAGNTLPIADAWPDGEIRTSHADLSCKAARFGWVEACAHHWWHAYLAAQNPVDAYAAWILFLRSADRRAWRWMREDVQSHKAISRFFELKLAHVQLNRSELKREMDKRLENPEKKFLDQDTVYGVGPWGTAALTT